MRFGTALVGALLLAGLTGCTATPTAPATTKPVTAPASPAPSTTASLSADAVFEEPIVCRAVVDYDTVQAAIGTGDLTRLHTVARLAATDYAAGSAADRAHAWSAAAQPYMQAYFAKEAEQLQYYRAVAKAATIDAAVNLQFPDGTTVTTPVFAAIGLPTSLTCPKP